LESKDKENTLLNDISGKYALKIAESNENPSNKECVNLLKSDIELNSSEISEIIINKKKMTLYHCILLGTQMNALVLMKYLNI
jgi:hypothetical protein